MGTLYDQIFFDTFVVAFQKAVLSVALECCSFAWLSGQPLVGTHSHFCVFSSFHSEHALSTSHIKQDLGSHMLPWYVTHPSGQLEKRSKHFSENNLMFMKVCVCVLLTSCKLYNCATSKENQMTTDDGSTGC